jgi:hypothetical protein
MMMSQIGILRRPVKGLINVNAKDDLLAMAATAVNV